MRRISPARCLLATLLLLGLAFGASPARAVEGGASHYIPGAYGDFLMGLIPAPGLYLRNDTLYQSSRMDMNLRGGKLFAGINNASVMNITKLTYLFDVPAMGGFLGAGLGVPFILNEHITGDLSADYKARALQGGAAGMRQLNVNTGGDRGACRTSSSCLSSRAGTSGSATWWSRPSSFCRRGITTPRSSPTWA